MKNLMFKFHDYYLLWFLIIFIFFAYWFISGDLKNYMFDFKNDRKNAIVQCLYALCGIISFILFLYTM